MARLCESPTFRRSLRRDVELPRTNHHEYPPWDGYTRGYIKQRGTTDFLSVSRATDLRRTTTTTAFENGQRTRTLTTTRPRSGFSSRLSSRSSRCWIFIDDVMPSTLRIFRAAAASADRLVVYDDDDDVMMMEWAFGETLQKVTKSYGNSTPSMPLRRRAVSRRVSACEMMMTASAWRRDEDDDDDDLDLSLGFVLHATRSADRREPPSNLS